MGKYERRRSSLIYPFGIGAVTVFPHDESLMIAGQDHWFFKIETRRILKRNGRYETKEYYYPATENGRNSFEVIDPRLSRRLSGKKLLQPPFNEERSNMEYCVGTFRFPLWYYCPICGKMNNDVKPRSKEIPTCDNTQGANCGNLPKTRRPRMVPERFITVCRRGHIDDFPIGEWIHHGTGHQYDKNRCEIVRITGQSAGLSGIVYKCTTCNVSKSMESAFNRGALDNIKKCNGNMPWLGQGEREDCGESLQTVQRGASNVWFGHVVSSLFIPNNEENNIGIELDVSNDVKELIEQMVRSIRGDHSGVATRDSIAGALEQYRLAFPEINDNFDRIVDYIFKVASMDEESLYRKAEFDVLKKDQDSDDLNVKTTTIGEDLECLAGVSLVKKLKETSAFVGFSRLSPDNPRPRISINPMDWLPAVQYTGEGIFLSFNVERLKEWARKDAVKRRVSKIQNNIDGIPEGQRTISVQDVPTNPAFYLLHTFAHCLINTLAITGGYPTTSIKERLYCDKFSVDNLDQMAGILIYTAGGDSAGSMGGLVKQGKKANLEKVIRRAITEAKWCTADPVCIDSDGQGMFGANLAACHNCVLLPETSCEERNMFLDRGLMVGTIENSDLGFFNQFIPQNALI